MEWAAPAQCGHSRLRLGEHAGGLGADERVLAIGFVPDGRDVDAGIAGVDDGLKLRLALSGEAVAHAEGVRFDLLESVHVGFGLARCF